jgi:hypothetical protein
VAAWEIGMGFEVVVAEGPERAKETPGFDRSLQGLTVQVLVVPADLLVEKRSWGLHPWVLLVDPVLSSLR